MRSKLLITLLLIGLISFTNVYAHDDHEETILTYNILQAPEYVEWWPYSSDPPYNVTFNTKILEVHVKEFDNSNSDLVIKIGDQEIETKDTEADGNLVLGYWNISLDSGFIADTNWDSLEQQLEDNTFITSFNMTRNVTSHTFTLNDDQATVDAIQYTFEDGFQTTTLLYSSKEGVLLYAITGFGNYLLEIEIDEVHGNQLVILTPESQVNTIGFFFLICSLAIIGQVRYIFSRKN
jgi:hypothetical protein